MAEPVLFDQETMARLKAAYEQYLAQQQGQAAPTQMVPGTIPGGMPVAQAPPQPVVQAPAQAPLPEKAPQVEGAPWWLKGAGIIGALGGHPQGYLAVQQDERLRQGAADAQFLLRRAEQMRGQDPEGAARLIREGAIVNPNREAASELLKAAEPYTQAGALRQLNTAMEPVRAAMEKNDLAGAAKAIDAHLAANPNLQPEVMKALLTTRLQLGERATKRAGVNAALTSLNGETDPLKIVLTLNDYLDPEVSKALIPAISNKFGFHVNSDLGMVLVTNPASGAVSAIPIPGATGIPKPTAEQEARAAQITQGQYDFRGLLTAARTPGPAQAQALQWVGLVTRPNTGQIGDLDAAVSEVSGGKFKTAEEAAAAGPLGAPVLGAARKLIQQGKVDVSAAQGDLAEQRRLAREDATPIGLHPGFQNKIVLDRKAVTEVDKMALTTGAIKATPGRYKTLDTQEDVKMWNNMTQIENVAMIYKEIIPDLANAPGGNVLQYLQTKFGNAIGVPTPGGVLDALMPMKLAMGRIFQGAGAQLSDRDVQSVEGLILTPTDSQATAQLKVAVMETFTRAIRAGIAGNKEEAAKAAKEFHQKYDTILKTYSKGASPDAKKAASIDFLNTQIPKGR